ncbi:hypothetical protein GX51_06652 [Blastomyces parvus]|uniref:Uncharacterized protein n=1 Tax=Blastomyces parvus TaxID=2060905 RepID=A0A2B7WQ25_9EURO|nr:hypothetical protein GX51_06652 [Blastomyces parvus]
MAGKTTEKPHGNSTEQNTHVQTQGRANSPRRNENAALKDKNTKREAAQGKEKRNVHASRTNEQFSDQNTLIQKDATDGRENRLNDTTKQDPKGKGNAQTSRMAKENTPIARDRSTVARTVTLSPNRQAASRTRSASPKKMPDKTARASKNDRPTASSSAPNSTNGDKKMEGKAKPQDLRLRSEMANIFAKAGQRVATDRSTPTSSRIPSPIKSTTERNVQSAPRSPLKGRKANNIMEDATIASGQSTNERKRARRGRRKKTPSTMYQGDSGTDSGSKSDASSPTKLPASSKTITGKKPMASVEASVNPGAVIGKVDIDTAKQSSKGSGARSRGPSPVTRDEIKPTKIDNIVNTKTTAPKDEESVNGDQSPTRGGREEAFAALGNGQGPSFTKSVNKRNRPRPSKAEKLRKRQAAAQADSPGLENITQDIHEGPGPEDDMNDHSMISIADIPSDDELGAEKIEEIFGRKDVSDSRKLECVKAIMMKQNQIIAQKTQLVNRYHKENEELQGTVVELDSSILTQEDDNNEQQSQVDELKMRVDEFQRKLRNQESFIERAQQEQSRLEEELNARSISLKSTEKDKKALKELVSKMENDMVQKENDIARLIEEGNRFFATISNYESERDELLYQLQSGPTQEENCRLEAELLEKNAELAVANQNFKDLQREYTALKKREKKEQGKRTLSPLSTELLLLGDGQEEDWEPAIDQSGVERNPFAPLRSPITTPRLFQFGEPTTSGNGIEGNEIMLNIPKTLLRLSSEETMDSEFPMCLDASTQTETTPSALSSMPKNEVEVLAVSTQTPAYVELGSHSSTQTNVVEMLEASTQTIAGPARDELEMLEASTQTAWKHGVSRGNQTVKLEILESSTQTAVDAGVHEVKMMESSTQTDIAAGVCETIDVLVQTEPVTVTQGGELSQSLKLALIMLAWAVIMLWGHREDQRLWLDANGVSRAALVGMKDRSLGPFLWIEQLRYVLVVWLQVDRVLPG